MADLKDFDESQPVNPYTNVDTTPKSTLGFTPDPMAQTVRDLPGKLLTNADENLTKNITAYTPKPPESQYGSIRMPRMGDDPADAGLFVMAGPIAVEQALGKLAVKALPGKVLENRLLQAGASKAELETRGVSAYLESKSAEPVSPLMLMKHLDENPYQLNEITFGGVKKGVSTSGMSRDDILRHDALSPQLSAAQVRLNNPNLTTEQRQEAQDVYNRIRVQYDEITSPAIHDETKFSQWQTPGGENYREILLQAPSEQKPAPDTSKWVVKESAVDPYTGQRSVKIYDENGMFLQRSGTRATTEDIVRDAARDIQKQDTDVAQFTGGHWQEPNVVAHMRVNDRTLPSGERALHVEEWQSDWNNQIRQFANTRIGSAVPSHPIVDNWQDLMARRTLKEAVDGGYDRLTWTTGQQQADRYDLSKHVDTLYVDEYSDTTYNIIGYKGDSDVLSERDIPAGDLARYIGKDAAAKAAEQIAQTGKARLSGLDLKVGGEWANKLYDESMVNRFNKIGKKYGVKVEDVPIAKGKGGYTYTLDDDPVKNEVFKTKAALIKHLQELVDDTDLNINNLDRWNITLQEMHHGNVHSLKITPEMRESIGASKFHPFADLPGPKPKAPPAPAAIKLADFHAQAALLDPSNPVRYIGDMGGRPMMQQEPPGVGSFIVQPGETVAAAFERAKARYRK